MAFDRCCKVPSHVRFAIRPPVWPFVLRLPCGAADGAAMETCAVDALLRTAACAEARGRNQAGTLAAARRATQQRWQRVHSDAPARSRQIVVHVKLSSRRIRQQLVWVCIIPRLRAGARCDAIRARSGWSEWCMIRCISMRAEPGAKYRSVVYASHRSSRSVCHMLDARKGASARALTWRPCDGAGCCALWRLAGRACRGCRRCSEVPSAPCLSLSGRSLQPPP